MCDMVDVQSTPPHPALRPFVCSFVQRDAQLGHSEFIEPVVARLGVKIEFKFAGLYQIRSCASNAIITPNRISVVGPQTFRRVNLTLSGSIQSLAVTFQPCGFHALFSTPTHSLADISTEGHSVLGKVISHLYEQLGNLQTFSDRTALLNRFFLRCLENAERDNSVYVALQRLAAGTHTIEDAADQACMCRRQFERKARIYTGVTPKDLTRIARFNRALRLSRESPLNWTEIAHAADYHDRMHMVHDFRVFAGDSPTGTRQTIAAEHLIHFCSSN